MVKLVRSFRVTGDWEKVSEGIKGLKKLYEEKYPQVKDYSFWSGITGPVELVYLELLFESLAEEEDWATKVIVDPEYMKVGGPIFENVSDYTDMLYRKWDQSPG